MKKYYYEKNADIKNHFFYNRTKYLTKENHFHNSIELIFCVKGSVTAFINDVEYTINQGDGVFIKPFEKHYYLGKDYECFVLTFNNSFYNQFSLSYNKYIDTLLPYQKNKTEKIIDFLYWSLDEYLPNVTFASGIINVLLGLIALNYPLASKKTAISNQKFESILKYIDDNILEDLTLNSLSEKFYYSTPYLSKLFNKVTGSSFNDYLAKTRIEKLPTLIENGVKNNTELMKKCGFKSLSSFYRAKKKFLS